jgi:phage-related protein (TIGR01555 family)
MLEGLRARVNGVARAAFGALDVAPPPAPSPPQLPAAANLLQLARARIPGFDQLINLASGIGTSRDKRTYTDYAPVGQISQITLDNMYQTSWSTGKTVNIPAEDSVREWITPSWDGYDKDQGGRDALQAAEENFLIPLKVFQARKWARLYGGCAIVPGFRNDQDMSQPLDIDRIGKDDLIFLHVLDRWRIAATGPLDQDPESPNMGYPSSYQIRSSGSFQPIVHWTRVIRFDGYELPYYAFQRNGYWHASEVQRVMENCKDYDHARAAIMALMDEANVDIQLVEGLGELLTSKNGLQIAQARFRDAALLKSITNTLVLDVKDKFQQKQIAFGGIPEVWRMAMLDLAGAADIPVTRFFAQSPTGLSATGESDLRNYYDRIHADQKTKMLPQLMRLYNILLRSVFGRMPEHFKIVFNPLWQLTDVEKSTAQVNRANRDKVYKEMGAIDVGVIARQLKYDGTYEVLEPADVEDAEAVAEQQENDAELARQALSAGAEGGAGNQQPPENKQQKE